MKSVLKLLTLSALFVHTLSFATYIGNPAKTGNGGTGVSSPTAESLLIGNGSSAVVLRGPGTTANLLMSNGTRWVSVPASVATTTLPTVAIAASGVDWLLGNVFTKTLAANTTFTFSNMTPGQTIIMRLTNTVSNYTVTWPGAVLWTGGTPPTMTVGAKSDVYTFVYDGSTIYGSYVQDF